MNNAEQIRQLMARARIQSKEQIDQLFQSETITFEELNERITDFILAKFMLEKAECEGIDFQKLSELSLAKTMKISPELVKEFDTARSCAGATSATAKKTLLYLAIQKALNIELAAEKTPKVHSFEEFTVLVWDGMKESDFWLPRLQTDPENEEETDSDV